MPTNNFMPKPSAKKLRIATTLTGAHTLPQPDGIVYAPMDLTVHLVRGLEARGHEVTVYAPEGSTIACSKLITGGLKPLIDDADTQAILDNAFTREQERNQIRSLWDAYLLAEMYRDALRGDFDIIHAHSPDRAIPFAKMVTNIPTVYTLHDPLYPWRREVFNKFATPNQSYVAISHAQQQTAPELPYSGVIHNGTDVTTIPLGKGDGDYLLYLGRIMPQKGLDVAIQVAIQSGQRLRIVGPTPHPGHKDWWDTKVAPYLNDRIEYVGPAWGADRFVHYGQAKALIVAIQWEEPFGLVMIEALASGTPVIGLRRATVPEIVQHGVTGFIADDLEGLVQAVHQLPTLDRQACRQSAIDNFSMEHMVDEYEKLFLRLAK